MISVSKQDEQGTKYSLPPCSVADIEETPGVRLRELQYLLWAVKANLFMEYNSAGFVPKWLFALMMFRKHLIVYGDTDVVYRIRRDMQRFWRV